MKTRFHVVAWDYGIKRNILRMLSERGCRVTVLPAQTPAAQALALKPDGVFLSNGPGDPEPCDYAIAAVREVLETTRIPVFGICLGHQLMALASRPAFCFQGHPEASPGPHDIGYLFDRFVTMMEQAGA